MIRIACCVALFVVIQIRSIWSGFGLGTFPFGFNLGDLPERCGAQCEPPFRLRHEVDAEGGCKLFSPHEPFQESGAMSDRPFVIYSLDSGLRRSHAAFQNVTILPAVDCTGTTRQHFTNDTLLRSEGHGTFTTSLAVKGVESKVVVVPVIVVSPLGDGDGATAQNAIRFAVAHKEKYFHPSAKGLILFPLAEIYDPWRSGWKQWIRQRLGFIDDTTAALTFADEHGFVTVAAAGNFDRDACNTPVGKAPGVITVGASRRRGRASYSNFGPCISVFAEGDALAASSAADEASSVFTGTSVAAPITLQAFIHYLDETYQFPQSQNKNTMAPIIANFLQNSTWVHDDHEFNMECSRYSTLEELDSCERTPKKVIHTK